MVYDYLDTPIGRLTLAADADGLRHVAFELGRHPLWIGEDWRREPTPFAAARAQLVAYFAGESVTFDLPLAPRGSAFDLRVWSELKRIPFGATISYGELARRVGDRVLRRHVLLRKCARAQQQETKNPLHAILPAFCGRKH